jgi:hypothetical protein
LEEPLAITLVSGGCNADLYVPTGLEISIRPALVDEYAVGRMQILLFVTRVGLSSIEPVANRGGCHQRGWQVVVCGVIGHEYENSGCFLCHNPADRVRSRNEDGRPASQSFVGSTDRVQNRAG